METKSAGFNIGQLVRHKLFHYRGVITDVDFRYMGTEEWYESVALSRPPKDSPWYRVLVHNALHMTYVAERNLEPEPLPEPVQHPLIDDYFDNFENGMYTRIRNLPVN